MFSPLRDMKNAIVRELEKARCSNFEFVMGGKHPKIIVRGPAGVRTIPFSGSPSCSFAPKKVARNVRHALREIGYAL